MVKYIEGIIIGIFIFLGIGYNTFSISNNNTNISKGIYYDSFKYSDNVVINKVDGTNLDFTGELKNPGDFYELSFDVVNSTTVDVKVSDFNCKNNDSYIEYLLTYSDGSNIKNGDIIEKGEKRRIYYKVLYKNPIIEDNYTFDSSFNINYEQVI